MDCPRMGVALAANWGVARTPEGLQGTAHRKLALTGNYPACQRARRDLKRLVNRNIPPISRMYPAFTS